MTWIDGELCDPVPMFELFVWAHIDRFDSEEQPLIVPRAAGLLGDPPGKYDVPFPHSISNLARASGLTQEEYGIIRESLSEVENLWLSLPSVEGAKEAAQALAGAPVLVVMSEAREEIDWRPGQMAPLIYKSEVILKPPILRASRFPTKSRGNSKLRSDPLVQTYLWLQNLGFEYPVIQMEIDQW